MDSITGVDSIQYHGVIIRASVDELGKSCEPGVAPSESRTEPGPSRTGDSVYAAGWKKVEPLWDVVIRGSRDGSPFSRPPSPTSVAKSMPRDCAQQCARTPVRPHHPAANANQVPNKKRAEISKIQARSVIPWQP